MVVHFHRIALATLLLLSSAAPIAAAEHSVRHAAAQTGFPEDLTVDGRWVDEDTLHMDGSYLALKDPEQAKEILGHPTGGGDYYTYLRLINQLDVKGSNCGRGGSWFFMSNATIDYVREPGLTYRLISAAPLIVVANNYDVTGK